jgi:hypothetical protein
MLVRQPHEERGDVAAALGCEARVGFSASLPLANGALLIELDRDGAGPIRFRHRLRIGRAMVLARLRLGLRFWRDALPIAPMIVKGLMRGDADLPRRVKVALRLGHGGAETSLDGAFLATPGAPAPAALETGVSVIVPVFNAFELLPEALDRVIRHTDLPWRLILIEDASTDPRVRPWLRDWVARQDAGEPDRTAGKRPQPRLHPDRQSRLRASGPRPRSGRDPQHRRHGARGLGQPAGRAVGRPRGRDGDTYFQQCRNLHCAHRLRPDRARPGACRPDRRRAARENRR